MESDVLLNNLQKSKQLIARYADLDYAAYTLKYYIQHYDKKSLFTFLSLIPTLILIYLPKLVINFRVNMLMFLIVAVISFVLLKYGFFNLLIRFKRKALWQENQPKLLNLMDKMNNVVHQLDAFTVLPPKYRTVHAADTLESYIVNKRIDNHKEGLNLYEDELLKMQQRQNQRVQIQQNYEMINQNKKMIHQNIKMIRAQAVTNALSMFK
ncbi:hypothetical protein DIU31_031505 [Mucilaginibacter rubeus]|uniref:Uncharacterized protein n=1 Tax=Mucilaginibacter rubeus TaxID=2027860 RepID=A0AAE6JLR8_9SPHI|nr:MULTISPECIES: hypothetical protein [Mucilaginibacter]QEM07808.1 hypothetical protein DIU31_031505 [Mucilaginibacter rubeus]QEM20260.1 hypothetical protein DIU38_031110 [Mucilaginibacter gossypii]QTE43022.1 hypothetical protein J3L19_29555 [Mucilaginibacter rubeus]QTE49623.1 hypothetical protein J3L21_29515 [Mucilaginibacter rubeus]QTE54718.1 hypothetical protein J3L23_21135 [Mucilaginibacter rubeus]